ncbi:hypothetical protein [Paractinoplanes brasiliensis]|uniref:Uncharacterized protein n=1 Tax=Paractinoplanes brasiliensis TaxID=52695 RepID=A0A4R6JZ32_9ACTN|nr:hypothetical protein [Actinoplanes brasiliensis]TDO42120.1 hypothetical protein C8E87_5883 [Actinoplanes brasiliensis]GID32017.1 hypothetical protein Abr02nite_70000 [Actinoplanes brasiliensis]
MAGTRGIAAADEVRLLAREGRLAEEFRTAGPARRRRLWSGAAEIAAPLLFLRLTRPLERRRGHYRCAAGLHGLAAECLDAYHDDLEALVDHLLTRAGSPVRNLEGWLTKRLHPATVDGNRKRRGRRGAAQRPRAPKWLADELAHDSRRVGLAVAILDWAGSEATAGFSLWPLAAWADRLGTTSEAVAAREVETVLTAMRRRPRWYSKNVERPMEHKQPPVWIPARGAANTHAEPDPVVVAAHEHADAQLRELAARAVEILNDRLAEGSDPAVLVPAVLRAVFGSTPPSDGLDRTPDADETGAEQVLTLLGDPARLDRVVAAVTALLSAGPDR